MSFCYYFVLFICYIQIHLCVLVLLFKLSWFAYYIVSIFCITYFSLFVYIISHRLRDNDEFGKSFRPRLPPRGRSFHQPMMVQATNFGFTQRELDKAKIFVPPDLNQNSEFTQMGAMGRSLFVRSKVINETSDMYRRNSTNWNESDKAMSNKKFSLTAELNHLWSLRISLGLIIDQWNI